jgi:hypothetical protein
LQLAVILALLITVGLYYQSAMIWIFKNPKNRPKIAKNLPPTSFMVREATPRYFSWYAVVLGFEPETFFLSSSNHSTPKSLVSILHIHSLAFTFQDLKWIFRTLNTRVGASGTGSALFLDSKRLQMKSHKLRICCSNWDLQL